MDRDPKFANRRDAWLEPARLVNGPESDVDESEPAPKVEPQCRELVVRRGQPKPLAAEPDESRGQGFDVRGLRTCLRLADGEILLRNGYHAAEGVLSTGLRCPCLRAPAAAFPHSAHSAPRGAAARRSSRTGVLWRSSQTRCTRPAKRYAPRGALRRRWSKRPIGCFIRCAGPGQRATLTPAGSGSPGNRCSMRRRRRCAVSLPRAVPKRWRSASPQAPGPLFPTPSPGSTG